MEPSMPNFAPREAAIRGERRNIASNTLTAIGVTAVGGGLAYAGIEVVEPLQVKATVVGMAGFALYSSKVFIQNARNSYYRMKSWQED